MLGYRSPATLEADKLRWPGFVPRLREGAERDHPKSNQVIHLLRRHTFEWLFSDVASIPSCPVSW